jgi:CO/xanthine dehydrogenase FAD-binding subunit
MSAVAFARPDTLAEATAMLRAHGEDARAVCGGTALTILLRQRLVVPTILVGIGHLDELAGIRLESDGTLRIGAAVRVRDAERDPRVAEWQVLREALHMVATPRIRNMATVGGGLSHADPAGDPIVALGALGALVRIAGLEERVVPVSEFARGYYETVLAVGELVVDVTVPPLPVRTGSAYVKYLPRTVEDYGTVTAAAVVSLGPSGAILDARLVLGAVGPTPVVIPVADALRGKTPGNDHFASAALLARDRVEPLDDTRGSAEYKREMAVVIGRRAMALAAARALHEQSLAGGYGL